MAGKKDKVIYCVSENSNCGFLCVGLGRQSQGMSTALAVEKTSKRGGKIINVAAERGLFLLLLIYCMSCELL